MTAPASESCGFYICYISFFIPPQVKSQSENVRFSSLHCNRSRGHRGAVPAWKIKPACPPWLPPNKIHSFAFPCCNLALLPRSFSFTISLSLIPASFQPRSSQFRRDWNVGGEERRGGRENKKQREAVLTQGCYLDRC